MLYLPNVTTHSNSNMVRSDSEALSIPSLVLFRMLMVFVRLADCKCTSISDGVCLSLVSLHL